LERAQAKPDEENNGKADRKRSQYLQQIHRNLSA